MLTSNNSAEFLGFMNYNSPKNFEFRDTSKLRPNTTSIGTFFEGIIQPAITSEIC